MKKIFILITAFFACCALADAQEEGKKKITLPQTRQTAAAETTGGNTVTSFNLKEEDEFWAKAANGDDEKKSDKWGADGSFGINYLFVEDGWGGELTIDGNGWYVGFMYSGAEKDKLEKSSTLLALGWQDRYSFNDSFFIQGRVAVGWGHSSLKYDGKELAKSDDLVLNLVPRVGVAFSKGFAATVGYEWCFTKFKFDKEHTSDCFTIGLQFSF